MADQLDPKERGEDNRRSASLNRTCISATYEAAPTGFLESSRTSGLVGPTPTTVGCQTCSSVAKRSASRPGACKGASAGSLRSSRKAWASGRSTAEAEELPRKYPYMFSGRSVGLTLFRGWTPILAKACSRIDELVVPRQLEFHWVVLQEEDGCACFVYSLGERFRYVLGIGRETRRALALTTFDSAETDVRQVDAIVIEAERLASESCLVCGTATRRASYFGQELPLCPRHAPERLNREGEEGLEGVWRCSIEWENV